MSALNVTIDPSIKGAWPEARLGCFIYTADVRAREDSLWTCLENEVAPYLKTMLETTPLAQIPNLAESRKAYKAFGKDPGRFRVSSESLYRRVRQGKALYQINSVVDANNLVSLETGFSLGSYDTARIGADIVFRLGKAGEVYPGIGKDDNRARKHAPARRRGRRVRKPHQRLYPRHDHAGNPLLPDGRVLLLRQIQA